jgi:hypothetical protein
MWFPGLTLSLGPTSQMCPGRFHSQHIRLLRQASSWLFWIGRSRASTVVAVLGACGITGSSGDPWGLGGLKASMVLPPLLAGDCGRSEAGTSQKLRGFWSSAPVGGNSSQSPCSHISSEVGGERDGEGFSQRGPNALCHSGPHSSQKELIQVLDTGQWRQRGLRETCHKIKSLQT